MSKDENVTVSAVALGLKYNQEINILKPHKQTIQNIVKIALTKIFTFPTEKCATAHFSVVH